jgi:hypothetical protein
VTVTTAGVTSSTTRTTGSASASYDVAGDGSVVSAVAGEVVGSVVVVRTAHAVRTVAASAASMNLVAGPGKCILVATVLASSPVRVRRRVNPRCLGKS